MASDLLVLRFLLAALLDRRPPVAPSFVARFYLPLYFTGDLRWPCLIFYVFTGRVLFVTTSGGPIFRCTTKDRGERRAKGIAIPLNPLGVNSDSKPDVLCATLLATVRLTRLSRAWRAQAHCFHALCVLRPDGDAKRHRRKYPWGAGAQQERKIYATTQPPTSHHAGYS